MIACTVRQVTTAPTGGVRTRTVRWPDFTEQFALQSLGVKKLGKMDSMRTTADGDIIVELAQERAWTWEIHTFVKVSG